MEKYRSLENLTVIKHRRRTITLGLLEILRTGIKPTTCLKDEYSINVKHRITSENQNSFSNIIHDMSLHHTIQKN
jgi:hypothetical protein